MKAADIITPEPLLAPIANEGLRNTLPDNATGTNYASIAEGFPEITMKAPKDGGLPPWGQDFNGMFYLMSSQTCFLQNGGLITFDQAVSDKIDGYPQGAILDYVTPENTYVKVKSLIDDNTYNFVTTPSYIDGEHWEEVTLAATTSWGDITGSISSQTDLSNILDNKTNTDLSNLTSVGIDKINQSKALETGAVSSDADVYADIQKYAKFEVVGSPNITDDGIASGFTPQNYLKFTIPAFANDYNNFTVKLRVKPGDTRSGSLWLLNGRILTGETVDEFSIYQIANSYNITYYSNNAYSWSSVPLTEKTWVNIHIKTEQEKTTVTYTDDSGSILKISEADTAFNFSKGIMTVYLGVNSYINTIFTGTIDLKSIAVWADGVPVFSGNKTGIDVIKPDNYEVVGTPTITDDGIVSNITSGVSITSPQTYSQVSDFTIVSPGITVNSIINNQSIPFCYLGSNVYLSYGEQQWAWMLFYVNNNSVKTIEQNRIPNLTLEFNKKYVFKLQQSYDGTKYTRTLQVYSSEDLSNPIGEYSYESLYPIYEESNGYNIRIINSNNNIDAEFDLNTCKFYQNGDLAYQPCLKIPYTESKTGSKIVDAAYRDRVQDVYEQYGSAPYYTIDEENQNFTLPMGEIYGMMITKTGDETISGLKTFNNSIIAHNSPGYTDRGVRYFSNQGTINWCQITQAWQVINGEEFKAETLLKVSPEGKPLFVFPKCTEKATTTSSASIENVAVVVQNYVNGKSWYRVWSDGWIEQGGRVQLTSQNTTGSVVSFLKAFQNTNYSVNAMVERYTSSDVGRTDDTTVLIQGLATNNMKLMLWDADNNNYQTYVRWRACGY